MRIRLPEAAVTYLKQNEKELSFSLPEVIAQVHNHSAKKTIISAEVMEHETEQHHMDVRVRSQEQ